MSLAIYAAPFENDSINNDFMNTSTNNSMASKKKNINNRTQKRFSKQDYNSEKVNSVLDAIHKNSSSSSGDLLGDFKPLSPPISVGVENTKINNPNQQISNHNDDDDIDLHNLKTNYMNEKVAEEYYKQFIPNYNSGTSYAMPQQTNNVFPQMQSQTNNNTNSANYTNDTLMTKLNYMIHLLEERQDERTNNVTEEVVLYSFLGVFMIFIVDSFVRVGKYVR
jgi:hypothetical protein